MPVAAVVLAVGGATALIGITPAAAATLTVTNCNDSGSGSLRQTVTDAASGDTITFALSPACPTITLASTIDIGTNLTIDGPGASALAVSGNNANTVFYTSGAVTISGLTIENGSTPSNTYGAGIANNGSLTVTDSILSNNKGAYAGGGIFSDGWLTVTNSTLTGNSAGDGGGIWSDGGTLTVTNSTLTGNSADFGGGIDSAGANSPGTQTVTDSTVMDNIASQGGGGIEDGGTLSVINSTLRGNSAAYGGGIDSIFADTPSFNNTVTISNSTISDNVAGVGGGIANYNHVTMTLTNSTLWGNSATDAGGGGISSPNTVTLAATIVANSTGGDCTSPVTDGGYNLDDDNTCGFTSAAPYFDLPNTNPKLGPLQANGGPTDTMALLAGSPAIDHVAKPSLCPATDQRGLARKTPCDIGAYDTDGRAITSANTATATNGIKFSFTITTTGTPAPSIVKKGTLPEGLHFVGNHNGTASISGVPHATRLGKYRQTFTATFAKPKQIVTQAFVLTVVS